ncbi:MAG: DUF7305 domain-containing protein [Planctomycetota bacterium]|jgi:hypothetical protein
MHPPKRPHRRGTVVVLTAVLLMVLFAMVAFAIDTGCIVHARTRLQRAADACALAAAGELPNIHDATLAARTIATENHEAIGEGLALGDDDDEGGHLDPMEITYGLWDRDTATFQSPPPYGYSPNAVRVTMQRSQATGNPVGLLFGRLLGRSRCDVSASAIALYDHWLCGPFIGIDWLSIPGSPGTDSYDSEKAPYSWSDARDRGSICSDGPIGVDGAALVRGDARAGKGHWVTLTGGGTVTRSIGSRKKPLNLSMVNATLAAASNDNAQIPLIPTGNSFVSPVDADGNFLLDGNKVIDMPPGTYYFNDFTLAGQAVFNVHGPTTIYIAGNMERAGGTLVTNPTQQPSNLAFLMTGGTANVTSNNDFFGVIYAPNTHITIDGASDYYGAVVGKTLTITGTGEGHYDESLNITDIEFPRRVALVD